MRERFREQVREDVKASALKQMAEGGAQAISLNGIARELGVSGPALYRYYSNRDELLGSLVVDAYGDLRDALADVAAERWPERDLTARVHAVAGAYRAWAEAHPHQYELLFRSPVPGYDAETPSIADAARSVMGVLLAVLSGESGDGADFKAVQNADVLHARRAGSRDFRYAVQMWTRLHGFVSLERGGAYKAMGLDADALFHDELTALTSCISQSE